MWDLKVLDGLPHLSWVLDGVPKTPSPLSLCGLSSLTNLAWAALYEGCLSRRWKWKLQKPCTARSGGHSASLPRSICQSSSEDWPRFKGKNRLHFFLGVMANSHCRMVCGMGRVVVIYHTCIQSFSASSSWKASVVFSWILTNAESKQRNQTEGCWSSPGNRGTCRVYFERAWGVGCECERKWGRCQGQNQEWLQVLGGIVLPFTEMRKNKFREKIKELIFENVF